jgi:hypothetical protein
MDFIVCKTTLSHYFEQVFLIMKKFIIITAAALALIAYNLTGQVQIPKSPSPEGAKAYIISPLPGETVGETFTVRFGLKGMGVCPAGLKKENTGHHHLLIDLEKMPDFNMPMPANDNLKHFGGGQTETVITLPPGTHTLQLALGDYLHIPHDPPVVSEKITVTVKGSNQAVTSDKHSH